MSIKVITLWCLPEVSNLARVKVCNINYLSRSVVKLLLLKIQTDKRWLHVLWRLCYCVLMPYALGITLLIFYFYKVNGRFNREPVFFSVLIFELDISGLPCWSSSKLTLDHKVEYYKMWRFKGKKMSFDSKEDISKKWIFDQEKITVKKLIIRPKLHLFERVHPTHVDYRSLSWVSLFEIVRNELS